MWNWSVRMSGKRASAANASSCSENAKSIAAPLYQTRVWLRHYFGVRRLAAALGWAGWRGLTRATQPTPKRWQATALHIAL